MSTEFKPFKAGDHRVHINPHAALQHGLPGSRIKDAVRAHVNRLCEPTDELLIIEHRLDVPLGYDPVCDIDPNMDVRYALDPDSKARRHNQQPMPFVLADDDRVKTNDMSIYVKWINGRPDVVRAHYGTPYPPPPFASSAQGWPGYDGDAPGVEGCLDFWRDCALFYHNPTLFYRMSNTKPNWLT